MDISAGLIAKGTLGAAAAAGAGYLGYNYKDVFSNMLSLSKSEMDEINKKIISLGLEESCKFTNLNTPAECDLDKAKLEKIKFLNKASGATISESDVTAKLKIEKTEDKEIFPDGFKFTFLGINKNIQIGNNGNAIHLKKNANPEFKINTDGANLSLEGVWDATKLAKRINLTCPNPTTTPNQCTFSGSDATNLLEWEGKETNATFAAAGKMEVTEGQDGYNQGLKFTVKDENITFETNKKLTKDSNYEVKFEGNKWYLKRVWGVEDLAKEAFEFESCTSDVCTIKQNKLVNVNENGNKVTDLKITPADGKVKFEKDQSGYTWGFKLTVQENNIALTEGTPTNKGIQNLVKDNAHYEIKYEDSKWFLSKRSVG